MSFNNPLMQLAVYTCILVISYLGAVMVVQSGNNAAAGLTTGQLTSMFTYTTQILTSLMMLSMVFVMLTMTRAPLRRSAEMMLSMVFVMLTMTRAPLRRSAEILTEQPELLNPEQPVTQVADGSIVFENVSFRYSKTAQRNALDQVNLHIASGMTVGTAWTCGSTTCKPCATAWPWCCKRTCCSAAPSRKISAGAIPMPPTRS